MARLLKTDLGQKLASEMPTGDLAEMVDRAGEFGYRLEQYANGDEAQRDRTILSHFNDARIFNDIADALRPLLKVGA